MIYEIGKVVDKFKHHQEGVQFELSDDGATMVVFFQNPSFEEIEQFKSGKNFEIRFIELYNVIMLTAKIGNLNWMDAPYTPHLSKGLVKFQMPNDKQGLALTLMLVDTTSGEIKHMRIIGMSENFTKKFFGAVMEQKIKEFDIEEYKIALNKIYSAYPTKKIVNMSREYCKINS